MIKIDSKKEAEELMKFLFPFSESDLLKTNISIKQTKINENDFRDFFYENFFDDGKVEFKKENSLYNMFYWYILEKIEEVYPIYNNFLIENLYIEDSFSIPTYKLKYNKECLSKEVSIKTFFHEFIEKSNNIKEHTHKNMFEWFVRKIFYDILCVEYIMNQKEIIPNIINKIKSSNLEFFTLNIEEIEKLLNITFSEIEDFEIKNIFNAV